MSSREKLILKLLTGTADANFDFDDLVKILMWFGLTERRGKGSHRIFLKSGIKEMINLQPIKGKAKPFQVKQVREFLVNNKLVSDD
jgi:predicted RNA binding protein YcfA (HicA-like mRNA interferase family)